MSRTLPVAATAALALSLSSGAAFAQNFSGLARQDLQTIHDELAANHPAAVVDVPGSESYRSWIDAGLQDSLGKLGQVNSGDSHAYLLAYYAGGFRDSNIQTRPTFEGRGPFFATSWPGFTTGWRDGQYVVTYVKPGVRGAPPVGAVAVSCNLQPIEQYARAKLDLWEADLNTEAGRVQSAPFLLWNRNNPFASGVPSVCNFKVGRRDREFDIKPQPVDAASLEAAYRATVYAPPAQPLSIETIDGRPWIGVHTLSDSNPTEQAAWRAFNAQLEGQMPAIRGSQGMVIDLRGATGSSVVNSTRRGYGLVNRIWSIEYAVSHQPSAGEITYRASPGNRQWYADTLGRMEADPSFVQENAAVIEDTRQVVAAFDAAIAAGQPTFKLTGRSATPDTGVANPVQGQVLVLVDSGCSGGCLDTLDLLSRMPNVRIAGTTTATDSIFIEPTVMRLPSNYSDLSYGHKAWTSRTRASGQPFTPAQGLVYTGNPADEMAVRAWVGTLFGG